MRLPWMAPMLPDRRSAATAVAGGRARRMAWLAVALAAPLLAGACTNDKDKYVERPPEDLYNAALDEMQAGKPVEAAKTFDEVERQHPYSSLATQAQIMSAYAYYKDSKYDDAVNALDRFIQLHPGNPDAVYAYYLKGLCYYEQIVDVGRDQRVTELALESLNEVVTRYPNTPYARDARLKVDLARDHLAGKEMEIGRYYLKRKQYLAAINRFRRVIEQYQTTTHVPEALERLTESYLALGVNDEAQAAAAVLGYNFPGSDWYQDSYNLLAAKNLQPQDKADSWLSKVF